jgi:hypothetical protein
MNKDVELLIDVVDTLLRIECQFWACGGFDKKT